MKKKNKVLLLHCLLVIVLLGTDSIFAQSIDHIRQSGDYYFGTGTGVNYQAARRNALADMSESISVQIRSAFEQVVVDTGDDVEIYAESVVNTYSNAVINRYEQRLIRDEQGDVEVMVYITKLNMQEAFRQREQMIHDFIRLGTQAKEELRIADALRYKYWALVLARTHPDNARLRYHFGGDTELPLMLTLNDRISRMLSFLSVEITSLEERINPRQKRAFLRFNYRGHPVQDIDYFYWLGDGYSALHSASNGMGFALLEGIAATELNQLRLFIEYQYANKAHLEPEVDIMIKNVNLPYFERAEKRIDFARTAEAAPEVERQTPIADHEVEHQTSIASPEVDRQTSIASPEVDRQTSFASIDSTIPEYNSYKSAVEQVVDAIKSQQHQTVTDLFTPLGYDLYKRLVSNGEITVLDSHVDTLSIIQVGSEIMVRSVPMMFAFHNNRERFIENVVFTFDLDGKITGLSYALSDIAINDILEKPEGFGSEEDKYLMIKFMEDYKTAFALQRSDYLDAIFDENALIIVGNVVQRSAEPLENVAGMYGNLSNTEIEYIRLSKSEYMQRLRQIFNRNEFINIRFENNQVRKTQRDYKVYGIQIAQHYYSSTYADKGYLFLMIDLNDRLNPKIYVRTWQPEKNPDGSIYGLEDFRF